MKNRHWIHSCVERLRKPPQLSRRDILLILVPALLWAGLTTFRNSLIVPHCVPVAGTVPAACLPESLWSFDRPAVGQNNMTADAWSYWTQNVSGIIAVAVPVIWSAAEVASRSLSPGSAAIWAARDLVIVVETTLWNGALNEGVRILSQRPRPFVYADPAGAAANPAHYISFYSGHTSFAAAATIALLLTLLGRGARNRTLGAALALVFALTVTTGILRVLAGRHFPTDVLVAAFAGALVALSVALAHRQNSSQP